MTAHLFALCVDAHDPLRLSRFWAGVLGWVVDTADGHDGITLLPNDETGFRIRFAPTQEQQAGQNQMHLDLTSTSLEDQRQTVTRALGLGARHIDIGQRPEEDHVVWDQDQETAIRSPLGGPKVTWGGPPLMAKTEKGRPHFDLAPPAHADQQAEVDRLVSLGATRVDIGQGEVPWVVMADPDGHELCGLTPL